MWVHDLVDYLKPGPSHGPARHTPRRPRTSRLQLEALEDRCLLSFFPRVSYAAGTNPTGVVTADFNGDGRLDLAVSNAGSNSVSILLGNGDGTFQAARNLAVGAYPNSVAVGDFNGDGKLDLVTANAGVSVLLGNGDGTFQPAQNTYLGVFPGSLAVGDLNADGKLDLAAASNDFTCTNDGYDHCYGGYYTGRVDVGALGNGDGTFAAPTSRDFSGAEVSSPVLRDFNGDGKLDLALADSVSSVAQLLAGNGDGTFAPAAQPFATATAPDAVAVADLNGDGKLDLVTAGYQSASALLGNGDGTFQAARNVPTGADPRSVAVADFNGDDKPDVVTANYGSDNVGVLLGNGDGSFRSDAFYTTGFDPDGVAAGDFNGDGRPDLAVADYYGGVSVLLNVGDGVPLPPSLRITDVTVTEGNTGTVAATFAVSLSAASTQTITVGYATGKGTATPGSDYTSTSGTLTFAPGETSKAVTVLIKGDRIAEPNETFVVNLSNPTNATIADGQGVGTILDDEPRVSITDVTNKEGTRNQTTLFTFTVTLSAAYDQPVTMSFATANGTAKTGNNDYVARSGTVTFAPGETTKTITIVVNGDDKKEADETFYVDLLGLSSNALFTKNRGTGTILNDD